VEAKAFLDSVLARTPQDVVLIRIRANTAERLFDRGEGANFLDAAIADYQQAMKLDPNHALLEVEYQRALAKKK